MVGILKKTGSLFLGANPYFEEQIPFFVPILGIFRESTSLPSDLTTGWSPLDPVFAQILCIWGNSALFRPYFEDAPQKEGYFSSNHRTEFFFILIFIYLCARKCARKGKHKKIPFFRGRPKTTLYLSNLGRTFKSHHLINGTQTKMWRKTTTRAEKSNTKKWQKVLQSWQVRPCPPQGE